MLLKNIAVILKNPSLDIKGLAIKKSNVPKKIRNSFTNILVEDVLKSKKLDVKHILSRYDAIENNIKYSLENGDTEFLFPKAVKTPESYKNPEQIEPIRASIIWNALEPTKEISLPDNIDLLKLKNIVDSEDPRLDKFKIKFPEKFERIKKVVFNPEAKIDISKFGFSVVGIPKTEIEIPEYLIPLINFDEMAVKNMANGLIILESLGINCETLGVNSYKTNIIEI